MPRRHSLITLTVSASLLALTVLAPAPAGAEQPGFCTYGSGPGQCIRPEGVAVDPVSGNVYVADWGNNQVQVFDSAGAFLSSCGSAGSGPGQFQGPGALAVDGDPASPSYRDLYVFDGGNERVEKFSPSCASLGEFGEAGEGPGQFRRADDQIAVGPGGTVYVADSKNTGNAFSARIERFEPSGAFVGSAELGERNLVRGLAIDSEGHLYVAPSGELRKYEWTQPNATLLSAVSAGLGSLGSLAIDASGHLFTEQASGVVHFVAEYDSSLTTISRFGFGQIDATLLGLAVNATGDALYGSEEYVGTPSVANRVITIAVPPPGPLACCVKTKAPLGNTQATLEAAIDPENKATEYYVDYVDRHSFETEGGFASPNTKSTAPQTLGASFDLEKVEAQLGCPPSQASGPECLIPETEYVVRLVAENADSPPGEPAIAEGSFETGPYLQLGEAWSSEVGATAAQLHGELNPFGISASGYFEYVDDADFQASGFAEAARVPPAGQSLDFGSGEATVARAAQLSGLAPGTLYHYRLAATDPLLASPAIGEAHAFATFPLASAGPACPNDAFRAGPGAALPDCRAYEMVSPPDKGGGDLKTLRSGLGFPAALVQSSQDGESISYSSSTSFAGAVSAPYSSQYVARRIAGQQWATEPISPPRSPESINTVANFADDMEYRAFSPDLGEGWLMHNTDPPLDGCAPAGFPALYRRDGSGAYEALSTAAPSNQTGDKYRIELQGLSADGTHAVFRADGKLTKDASDATSSSRPIYQLYEHVAGKGCGALRLVSKLPGGSASPLSASAGTATDEAGEGRTGTVASAVSEDGSRIYWTASQGFTGPGALYLRVGGKETLQVSAGPARFWTASPDGSRALYTLGDTEHGKGQLFEYDLASESSTPISGEASGVAATSKDLSRVYFVSAEALGGEGEAGKPNLYLREAGTTVLVATLDSDDVTEGFRFDPLSVVSPRPVRNGTRTTANGDELVFASAAPLSGYDSTDTASGARSIELYLYEAGSGDLRCISCNPSGERPQTRRFTGTGGFDDQVAAQLAPAENQLYAPRDLSASGDRLFFESYDALIPRDTNGRGDVYEWERAAGAAQCEEGGADLYVASAGGCLSLISSGHSPSDTTFADASPNGRDAFIETVESLLPRDPGLLDLYDAREGGGLPGPAPVSPACEGEACQSPPEAPDDPTPASSSFQGAGNVEEGAKPCRKPRVRRHGRCVARHPHKRRAKHGRGAGR